MCVHFSSVFCLVFFPNNSDRPGSGPNHRTYRDASFGIDHGGILCVRSDFGGHAAAEKQKVQHAIFGSLKIEFKSPSSN